MYIYILSDNYIFGRRFSFVFAEIAIIEMGTYGRGEIKDICTWVRPHVAVITGIGPVHLERMKTYENILDAKSEIVDLAGSVVINGDDEMLIDKARTWLPTKQVIDCSIESLSLIHI